MKKNNFIIFYLFLLFQYFVTLNVYSETLIIGDKNAKITVKVFSSLTCPHCASFHKNIYEKLKDEYIDKNKVRLEHHAFPLDLAALNAEKIMVMHDGKLVGFDNHKMFDELTGFPNGKCKCIGILQNDG